MIRASLDSVTLVEVHMLVSQHLDVCDLREMAFISPVKPRTNRVLPKF